MKIKHYIRKQVLYFIQRTPFESFSRYLFFLLSNDQGTQYDRETILVMKKILNSQSNCVDIGAYRGEILKHMLNIAIQGKVFAFEAIPENCSYLKKKYKRADIYNLALSDCKGSDIFYHVIGRPARSGLRKQDYPNPNEVVETIKVNVDTLDNQISENNKIMFVKIDVEGAELSVLQGARNLLQRDKPIIVFEHDIKTATKFDTSPEALYDFLVQDCQYKVSLMSLWLENKPSLDKKTFTIFVKNEQEFYFIAY